MLLRSSKLLLLLPESGHHLLLLLLLIIVLRLLHVDTHGSTWETRLLHQRVELLLGWHTEISIRRALRASSETTSIRLMHRHGVGVEDSRSTHWNERSLLLLLLLLMSETSESTSVLIRVQCYIPSVLCLRPNLIQVIAIR